MAARTLGTYEESAVENPPIPAKSSRIGKGNATVVGQEMKRKKRRICALTYREVTIYFHGGESNG